MDNDDSEHADSALAGLNVKVPKAADAGGERIEVPPLIINWRELSDGEAREVWEELRSWVRWACVRYQLPEQLIPECWWRHPYLVEELSALFASWMAFFDAADTGAGPLTWLEKLASARTRIREVYGNTCQRGHMDLPSRTWATEPEPSWDEWINATHGRHATP